MMWNLEIGIRLLGQEANTLTHQTISLALLIFKAESPCIGQDGPEFLIFLALWHGSKSRIIRAEAPSALRGDHTRCINVVTMKSVAMITALTTDGDRPVSTAKAQRATTVRSILSDRPRLTA